RKGTVALPSPVEGGGNSRGGRRGHGHPTGASLGGGFPEGNTGFVLARARRRHHAGQSVATRDRGPADDPVRRPGRGEVAVGPGARAQGRIILRGSREGAVVVGQGGRPSHPVVDRARRKGVRPDHALPAPARIRPHRIHLLVLVEGGDGVV